MTITSELSNKKFGKLKMKYHTDISHGSHEKIMWICDCGRETLAQVYNVSSGHTTSCGMCNEVSSENILNEKFGKLRIKNSQNILPGSHEKIMWICDCGKEKLIPICNVTSGKTKSCGRCNEVSKEEMAVRKFGKLKIKDPQVVSSGSAKKVVWICDCGKEKIIKINHVLSNSIKSCGRCNEISNDEMATKKFGKLKIKDPQSILPGSNEKILWMCDCGKETLAQVCQVTSGSTSSCGRCNEISASEMSTRKFGKLKIKYQQDILPGSNKKAFWVCECGKEKLMRICKVTSGRTSSCGRCNEIPADEMSIRKFGKLKIKYAKIIKPGSNKKVIWICDCGKEKLMSINAVLSGSTKSCGRCNEISAEEMSNRKFGKLKIRYPQDILSGSSKKIAFICDCGKETQLKIYNIMRGITKSCGRCNEISAEEMSIRKFGKLKIKNMQSILKGSNKKVTWICDCGKETFTQIHLVVSGGTSSCGRCDEISAEESVTKKFGRLKIKDPQIISSGLHHKTTWICDCGKETSAIICNVMSGNTSSCGHCHETANEWYLKNKEILRSLKCPIKPEDFPSGGPVPLETITKISNNFRCICMVCKKEYRPKFGGMRYEGESLTCGCASFMTSKGQIEVAKYIKSLGFEVQLEYNFDKWKYDIFVPSKNLLIEYQGRYWHSMSNSVERDQQKQQTALNNGYKYLLVFDDVWIHHNAKIKNYIGLLLK